MPAPGYPPKQLIWTVNLTGDKLLGVSVRVSMPGLNEVGEGLPSGLGAAIPWARVLH